MLNNKGQTLVIFVILIPIIILLLGMVVDIGLMELEKTKVSSTLKNTIAYGLENNSSEDELRELIDRNLDYEKLNINIDNEITIHIEYHYRAIFKLINNNLNITYTGYKDNNQIKYKEG